MGDLIFNDPTQIKNPADVKLPTHAHHLKIRSELTKLVEVDVITSDEADELYENWKA